MRTLNYKALFLASILFAAFQPYYAAAQNSTSPDVNSTTKPFSFPLQLEMRVPFDPTAITSGTKSHLFYELYLTNFTSDTIKLRRIELIDDHNKTDQPVAIFNAGQLQAMVQPLGETGSDNLTLAGGQTAIVFIEAIVNAGKPFPVSFFHRVVTDADSLDGASISTRKTTLQVFGSPVKGGNWTAVDGPGNDADNHHRRGSIILDGRVIDSRRYAIDWKKFQDSASFSGDPRNVHSYFCYGEPVYAVANGRVIVAKEGLPDNVPGHGAAFHPAAPLTLERLAGNTIVIDVGHGQYAHYMHLQPKSLLVKVGDQVHKGQMLARIGSSGDAREPHLHFEVTTSPHLLRGEGIPYLIDRYRLIYSHQQPAGIRINSLPGNGEVIDFNF